MPSVTTILVTTLAEDLTDAICPRLTNDKCHLSNPWLVQFKEVLPHHSHSHVIHTWQPLFLSSVFAVIRLPTGAPSPPELLRPEGASGAQPALMSMMI